MNEHEPSAFDRWETPPDALSDTPADSPLVAATASTAATAAADYASGYAAGLRDAQAAAEPLRVLADNFSRLLDSLETELAEVVRDLALEVARQVVIAELGTHPDRVLDVVRGALQHMSETSREARLLMHPDDVRLVRPQLEAILDRNRVRLIEDARLVRGGCRIETAHGDIDASLPTRWRQVVLSLGSGLQWGTDA